MTNNLDKHVAAYQGQNIYDFDNEIILNWYPQRILRRAGTAASLLELGLGHGYTTKNFSQHFSQHTVLEGSGEVIRNFHKTYPDCPARIIETYFETFDTDERFDVIVMGFILEHVEDPQTILKRFRKFLSPNGCMFLAVPNAEVLNRRLGFLAGILENIEALSQNDTLLGHKRYYSVTSLQEEIAHAGFKIDCLEGIYLKPFTTRQMLSLNLDHSVIDALCTVGIDYPELSVGLLAQMSVR